MKSIKWRKGLKEGAAEEGGSEKRHVPGWRGRKAGRKTSLGGIAALHIANNTTGL